MCNSQLKQCYQNKHKTKAYCHCQGINVRVWWSTKKFTAGSYSAVRSLPKPPSTVCFVEWFAIITCMYICLWRTIEILSNMETKLCLVLHVDHKPLNIQTTQLNRLRNVNAIVLFIQLHRSSTVHLRLFTVQPLPSQDGGELARRSNHNHIYIYVYGSNALLHVCLSAHSFLFRFRSSQQQTFTK